jgi:hypothetical protein
VEFMGKCTLGSGIKKVHLFPHPPVCAMHCILVAHEPLSRVETEGSWVVVSKVHTYYILVRFYVLMALSTKTTVFWDVYCVV